jgi:hypothetical protein
MNKKTVIFLISLIVIIFVVVAFVILKDSPPSSNTVVKVETKQPKKHRVRPFQQAIRLPRWKNPENKTEVAKAKKPIVPERLDMDEAVRKFTKEFTLPDGSSGVIYSQRPAYPTGASVTLGMDLVDPKGKPLSGKNNVTVMFVRSGFRESRKGRFGEYAYKQPGHYKSLNSPDEFFNQPGKIKAVAFIPETDLINAPGEMTTVELNINTGIPVWLDGGPYAEYNAQGLAVQVGVAGSPTEDVYLAADLVDAAGNSLGATSAFYAGNEAGREPIILFFPGIKPSQESLFLVDTTLWYGPDYKLADFWTKPKEMKYSQPTH